MNLHNNNIHTYDEVPEETKGDDPILGGGVTLKENNKQQQTAIQGWANYRKLTTHRSHETSKLRIRNQPKIKSQVNLHYYRCKIKIANSSKTTRELRV
jgi:hypothetical protein